MKAVSVIYFGQIRTSPDNPTAGKLQPVEQDTSSPKTSPENSTTAMVSTIFAAHIKSLKMDLIGHIITSV